MHDSVCRVLANIAVAFAQNPQSVIVAIDIMVHHSVIAQRFVTKILTLKTF